MAYIYKITNQKNGKMYIGKTIGTIEDRWRGHLSDSHNPQRNARHLYRAMNYYGVDNFIIEAIEEIEDVNQLAEREQYWISYYDTYHNGYNETYGGDGKHYLNYDLICQKYQELGTCKAVAQILGIDAGHVSTILKSMGFEIKRGIKKKVTHTNKTSSKSIDMYDLSNKYICTFNSITEASQWCIDNEYTNAEKIQSVYSGIMRCLRGDIKYSHQHIWRYHK